MSRQPMPSKSDIIEFWTEAHTGLGFPHRECCFVCSFDYGLERAHLIDHCEGGAETSYNIVLLCQNCHAVMFPFDDWDDALFWILTMRDVAHDGLMHDPIARVSAFIAEGGVDYFIKSIHDLAKNEDRRHRNKRDPSYHNIIVMYDTITATQGDEYARDFFTKVGQRLYKAAYEMKAWKVAP